SDEDAHDPIRIYNLAHPSSTLPTNWKYQVRYHYDFMQAVPGSSAVAPLAGQYPWLYGYGVGRPKGPPVLMMTSVATRATPGATPTIRRQVYSYLMPGSTTK